MMKFEIEVYDKCKYEADSSVVATVVYENVKSFEVKAIEDEDIYKMGFDEVDEYKEYLILTMADGETSTFRNSLVDMFRA